MEPSTAATAGLASILTAAGTVLVQWLKARHEARNQDRDRDESIWQAVAADLRKQVDELVAEVKRLREAEANCRIEMAAVKARLEQQEKEIEGLRQQLKA